MKIALVAMMFLSACSPSPSQPERSMTCVVRGRVREVGVVDLSKTLEAKNLYTELLLEIEDVSPAERRAVVTNEIVFFQQGTVSLKTGQRVELEVSTLDWNKPKRLRILKHKVLES